MQMLVQIRFDTQMHLQSLFDTNAGDTTLCIYRKYATQYA